MKDEYAWKKPAPNELNSPQVVLDQLWNIGRDGYEVPQKSSKGRKFVST
jgi:hypothetical protein